jgi:hypothetical protein
MRVHVYSASTWEAEAEDALSPGVQEHSGQHNKNMSQKH